MSTSFLSMCIHLRGSVYTCTSRAQLFGAAPMLVAWSRSRRRRGRRPLHTVGSDWDVIPHLIAFHFHSQFTVRLMISECPPGCYNCQQFSNAVLSELNHCLIINRASRSLLRQVYVSVFFCVFFSSRFLGAFWRSLGPTFSSFGSPGVPKGSHFGVILVPFSWPVGNVRIELSLERELDPGGLGGSKNHIFSTFFLGTDLRRVFMVTFWVLFDFRGPKGAHWAPKWLPNGLRKVVI